MPSKINISRVASLIGEEVNETFLFEMAQHIKDSSFMAYISDRSILAVKSNLQSKRSFDGSEVWEFDDVKYLNLIDHSVNDDTLSEFYVDYKNGDLLVRLIEFNNILWKPCEPFNANPYYEGYGYMDAIFSPLVIPVTDIMFDTKEIQSFFNLLNVNEHSNERKEVINNVMELRSLAFRFWVSNREESEVKSMKKEDVWQALGQVDSSLFPPLGKDSITDFFRKAKFEFKRGRRR